MALDGPHPTLRALEGDNGIALYCRRDPGCNLGTGVQSLDIWTHTDTTPFPAPMVAHESTIQTPLGGSLHACSANAFKPSSRPPSPLANRQWPAALRSARASSPRRGALAARAPPPFQPSSIQNLRGGAGRGSARGAPCELDVSPSRVPPAPHRHGGGPPSSLPPRRGENSAAR